MIEYVDLLRNIRCTKSSLFMLACSVRKRLARTLHV